VISLSNNSELNTTTLQGTDFRVLSDLTARLNVGKLTGREVRIEALQVSQVNALEGEVERLELRADGTSQVDLGRVRVGDAVLNAGEVSTIAVYVTNTAKANAVGVSRIFIAGNPKVEESKDMISEIVVGGTPGQKVDDMGSAGGKPRWEDYVDDDEGEWGGVFAPRTIGRTRWSEYANNGW
jgi:hypothetical protein